MILLLLLVTHGYSSSSKNFILAHPDYTSMVSNTLYIHSYCTLYIKPAKQMNRAPELRGSFVVAVFLF